MMGVVSRRQGRPLAVIVRFMTNLPGWSGGQSELSKRGKSPLASPAASRRRCRRDSKIHLALPVNYFKTRG